jgi:hypothetical protein
MPQICCHRHRNGNTAAHRNQGLARLADQVALREIDAVILEQSGA